MWKYDGVSAICSWRRSTAVFLPVVGLLLISTACGSGSTTSSDDAVNPSDVTEDAQVTQDVADIAISEVNGQDVLDAKGWRQRGRL